MKTILTSRPKWLYLIVLLVCLLPVSVVSAQDGETAPPDQCTACHRDLYLFFDTGKSYCLCKSQVACVDCHHGDPQAVTAQQAHVGMIARPACLQTNTCKDCHPDNYQQQIDKFAAIAGIHATPCPLPECEKPPASPASGETAAECTDAIQLPWREVAAGFLGASSLSLAVLAAYLYKSDKPTEGSQ